MPGIKKFHLGRQAAAVRNKGVGETKRPVPALPQPPASDPIGEAMAVASSELPRLLTPSVVAEMLGVAERTLERWRIVGDGPRYIKLSRSTVRYTAEEVSAFIAARLRANTAQ